jgi:hypothetical protein
MVWLCGTKYRSAGSRRGHQGVTRIDELAPSRPAVFAQNFDNALNIRVKWSYLYHLRRGLARLEMLDAIAACLRQASRVGAWGRFGWLARRRRIRGRRRKRRFLPVAGRTRVEDAFTALRTPYSVHRRKYLRQHSAAPVQCASPAFIAVRLTLPHSRSCSTIQYYLKMRSGDPYLA